MRIRALERGVTSTVKYRRNSLEDWLEAYVLRKVTIEVAAAFQKMGTGIGAGEFNNFWREEGGLCDGADTQSTACFYGTDFECGTLAAASVLRPQLDNTQPVKLQCLNDVFPVIEQ